MAGVLYQNLCASCHGTKGEGKAEVKAPSIAGLPAWYVRTQLGNFRRDLRGAHPQDAEGQLMRAVSKVLTPAQAESMAGHVAGLSRVRVQATLLADPAAGRELYTERCMECHRYNGEGELFFGSPPLVGLPDWYLVAQLRKYQQGVRGADPKDVNGQKMVFSAGFIEDEAMLNSLVAFLMEIQQPKNPEPAGDPFLLREKEAGTARQDIHRRQ